MCFHLSNLYLITFILLERVGFMSSLDIFLWIVFPYISLTIFVLGHIYRYNTDQFGWTAKSSQFLEQKRLRFGSTVLDRKSTRLNSSHVAISYAVFCLKKKINKEYVY